MRTQENRRDSSVRKAACILEYKKHMEGVERTGQYLSYYYLFRRQWKEVKRLYCGSKSLPYSKLLGYVNINTLTMNNFCWRKLVSGYEWPLKEVEDFFMKIRIKTGCCQKATIPKLILLSNFIVILIKI